MTAARPIPGTGGRFAVAGVRDWLVATAAAPLLLHLFPRLIERAALRGDWRAAHAGYRRWGRLAIWLLRVRVEVRGVERLPPRPCVILALHEGMADLALLLRLGRPMRFVAARELLGWPILGRHLRRTGQLPIETRSGHRTAGELRTLLSGAQRAVLRGEDLVVFGQGTLLGLETAIQPGALHLARSLGVPLVPVSITGSHRIWEHPFSPRLRFGERAGLTILAPLDPASGRTLAEVEGMLKRATTHPGMPSPRRYDPDRDGWWGYRFEIDPAYPELAARLADHRRLR